jgi:hypothetical protein
MIGDIKSRFTARVVKPPLSGSHAVHADGAAALAAGLSRHANSVPPCTSAGSSYASLRDLLSTSGKRCTSCVGHRISNL